MQSNSPFAHTRPADAEVKASTPERRDEFLGPIAVMLPDATVPHHRRDLLDTGLSCFFQNFTSIGNIWFANDLAERAARHRQTRGNTALPVQAPDGMGTRGLRSTRASSVPSEEGLQFRLRLCTDRTVDHLAPLEQQ